MNASANITLENNRLIVSGDLDFATVMSVWENSLLLMPQATELHFDFSNVKSSNSAGIALLIEWIKSARKQKKSIQFKNIPQDLMSIATICGVQRLL